MEVRALHCTAKSARLQLPRVAAPCSPAHLYTKTALSLWAIASLVESGENCMPRTTYAGCAAASAALVLNLSRLSPFSSNKFTTLSAVTAASLELRCMPRERRVLSAFAVPGGYQRAVQRSQCDPNDIAQRPSCSLVRRPAKAGDLLNGVARGQDGLLVRELHPARICFTCELQLSFLGHVSGHPARQRAATIHGQHTAGGRCRSALAGPELFS